MAGTLKFSYLNACNVNVTMTLVSLTTVKETSNKSRHVLQMHYRATFDPAWVKLNINY